MVAKTNKKAAIIAMIVAESLDLVFRERILSKGRLRNTKPSCREGKGQCQTTGHLCIPGV